MQRRGLLLNLGIVNVHLDNLPVTDIQVYPQHRQMLISLLTEFLCRLQADLTFLERFRRSPRAGRSAR
jgi:hypothetical protein